MGVKEGKAAEGIVSRRKAGSRAKGRGLRVEGQGSRVEGPASRVNGTGGWPTAQPIQQFGSPHPSRVVCGKGGRPRAADQFPAGSLQQSAPPAGSLLPES